MMMYILLIVDFKGNFLIGVCVNVVKDFFINYF